MRLANDVPSVVTGDYDTLQGLLALMEIYLGNEGLDFDANSIRAKKSLLCRMDEIVLQARLGNRTRRG